MLKIGDKIPNINVTTHKGESVNLSDFKGKKIVLFFYQSSIESKYKRTSWSLLFDGRGGK